MSTPTLDPFDWNSIEPHYRALQERELNQENAYRWLLDWGELEKALAEARVATNRARTEDTTNQEAERAFHKLVEEIQPRARTAGNALKEKLLAVPGLQATPETTYAIKRFQAEARIFRPENTSIQAELEVLASRYDDIVGAMSVTLGGEELTLAAAQVRLLDPDRATREEAWRAIQARWLQERAALDELFLRMLPLRRKLAANAGLRDYRDFAWVEFSRFDYAPADTIAFHEAIEREIVPLATRLLEERRANLGLTALRPWDVDVDPRNQPPLKPFTDEGDLEEGVARILERVDPELGRDFALLRDGYLDLAARKGKAPGGYCDFYPVRQRPYIFMNAAGTQDDVNTLLHEAGHAVHALAASRANPLPINAEAPTEFAEVASMGMELLASPYLEKDKGGFYTATDARRARREHLENAIQFLPYMAVVDAFQHWVYAEAPGNVTAADLDAKWDELWQRFMPGVDWSGLEAERASGWHRKLHIFQIPFYYVEYGLAQVGAWQVWRNALADQARSLAAYRSALALGATRPLPQLFEAAGGRLAFGEGVLADIASFLAERLDQS